MERIRLAAVSDSDAILSIYAPYITDTAISFETDVPETGEFSRRIEKILKQYPFLVYQIGDELAGYAYASAHRERSAYRYDADVSIYIAPRYHGAGIAQRLYNCLFAILKVQGYLNVYAGCTGSNKQSLQFHQKLGFSVIGTYRKTGFKFGAWHDVTWFEKTLNTLSSEPPAIKPVGDLPGEFLRNLFLLYSRK